MTLIAPSTPIAEPLLGRHALVTGASRGIGAAIARSLDAAGARVVLSARSEDDLRAVASSLHNDPVALSADLLDPDETERLAADALAMLDGRIDILVNNAGAVAGFGPAAALTADTVDGLLALNVRAPLLLAARLAPGMAERGGGCIVNVSSVLSDTGTPYSALYNTTKAALDGATRALAAELGPLGIRVNAVKPGATAGTGLIPGVDLGDTTFTDTYNPQVPLRRVGRPEDVAALVAFLASDAAAYISAQLITVDGGWQHTATPFGGA
jgi:NAD(P)-dependent dehydrogenase (short-subunit alcohol dehydrogenase family)